MAKSTRVAWDVGEDRIIEEIEARLESPLLYVSLRWRVYGRSEDGERPVELQTVDDLHVFIDRDTGDRVVIRHDDWDPKEWTEYLELSQHVPLEYSVHEKQLAFIFDEEHRVIFAGGGQRGGKTQAAALWTVRQWAIKGGRGVFGYWVAPNQDLAQIGVAKLCVGEDDLAPLFPPELVLSYPASATAKDQSIQLVDFTAILVKHGSEHGKGANLKGRGPRWITVDEACEIRPIEVWRVLRGRLNMRGGHKGQMFLSSTPMPGHWAHSEIVLPVEAGRKPTFAFGHLSMVDNPWIPESEVEEAIEDAGGRDDPVCQREVLGKFVADGQALWYAFRAEKHIRTFSSMRELGLIDVTSKVVARYFPRLSDSVSPQFLGGQDFNLWPMSTVVLKIGLPEGVDPIPTNYVVVVWAEIQSRNLGSEMHGHKILEKGYDPMPIACDPTGAQPGHRLDGKLGEHESSTEAEDLALSGHDVRPANRSMKGEPVSPPQIDNLRLVHHLMQHDRFIAHSSCRELFRSLTQQQATGRGTIYKKPGTTTDRLSSVTDAMRYPIWLCFKHEIQGDAPALQMGA